MSKFELLSVIIAGVTACINLGALAFVGRQVRQAAAATEAGNKERGQEWAQRRRESTMRFYLSTIDLRDRQQARMPAAMDREGIRRLLREAEHDTDKLAAIRSYLSMYELLATGVNLGILDDEVIARFGGTSLIAIWQHYKEWALEQRVIRLEPSVYIELEKLAVRTRTQLARYGIAVPPTLLDET